MRGNHIKLDTPWRSAVVVKKYAAFATLLSRSELAELKKSVVMLRMATVGPAARKLPKKMANETRTAM
jgi:hypothetical protein